jgi:hypothetical protein
MLILLAESKVKFMKLLRAITIFLLIPFLTYCCTNHYEKQFKITESGLYLLKEQGPLTKLSEYGTANYLSFGDIYFFEMLTSRYTLVVNLNNSVTVEIPLDYVEGIRVLNKNKFIVDGIWINTDYVRTPRTLMVDGSSVTDALFDTNLSSVTRNLLEKTGQTVYFGGFAFDEMTDSDIDKDPSNDLYSFMIYGNRYTFDLSNIIPKYAQSNLIIHHELSNNCYFISANNFGRLE